MKNLASAAVARKVKGKDAKLVVLKTTTDLLGRLVYLACAQEIDLARVFEYPLTLLPLSLAAIDGSMNKTSKSALSSHLNDLVSHGVPDEIDVIIDDMMAIIQALPSIIPDSHGGLARKLLIMVCKTDASEVYAVFDTYERSIKDVEQETRGEIEGDRVVIIGSAQTRPKDLKSVLYPRHKKQP